MQFHQSVDFYVNETLSVVAHESLKQRKSPVGLSQKRSLALRGAVAYDSSPVVKTFHHKSQLKQSFTKVVYLQLFAYECGCKGSFHCIICK